MFKKFSEKLKTWFIQNAEKKTADRWLKIISFTESSFFPIPPDPFLISIIFVKPHKWLKLSYQVIIFSVIGGLFGYLIGYTLFDLIGKPIINFYSLQQELEYIGKVFSETGFWTVLLAALTPIPYKIFTISAGLFKLNILVFLIASVIGRGVRFILIGYMASFLRNRYGEKILRNFNLISMIFAIIIIGYLIFQYL